MDSSCLAFMLAVLGGSLALLLGVGLLLLPLLVLELSRPRDSAWGAVVLLLGLVLVTSADRFTGAPMLGVLCGGLLIGRLGVEVGQGRWRALSDGERQLLASPERWQRSLEQLLASLNALLQSLQQAAGGLLAWWQERRQKPASSKRWIRSEDAGPAQPPAPDLAETGELAAAPAAAASAAPTPEPEQEPEQTNPVLVRQVSDFAAIDVLLEQAGLPDQEHPPEPGADGTDAPSAPPAAEEAISGARGAAGEAG